MLSLFRASDAVEPAARVVVVAVLDGVRDRVVDEVVLADAVDVVGLATGLVEDTVLVRVVVGFLSAAVEPATLDLRSRVVVGLVGALVEELPISDIRFAVPEIPLFSSPELATDRDFSSAELLTDARDRWEAVVDVLKVLREVVDVVVGRVGGLFNVLLVEVRDAEVGFVADDMEVGLFVAVVPETGRLVVAEVALFFAGEVATFSLAASGLVIGSSPEGAVESTGVAGAALSDSGSAGGAASTRASVGASAGGTASAGEETASAGAFAASDGGIGSSVDAMMDRSSHRDG